jgi:uncharacterized protein YebE (UPF0316 family)
MGTPEEAILLAVVIFAVRVFNSAVGTIRLVVMGRGQHFLAVFMGFFEALIFVWVTANVITDMSNLLNLMAYCGGFAIGIWVGMIIEARFVTSYVKVNIITRDNGHDMAVKLRESGYGVTEIRGEGGTGEVAMLNSVIYRVDVPNVLKLVYAINPKAFVTLEEARSVQHGYLRALRHVK